MFMSDNYPVRSQKENVRGAGVVRSFVFDDRKKNVMRPPLSSL